jgi:DNA-binding CsgD family transcriptional regulator
MNTDRGLVSRISAAEGDGSGSAPHADILRRWVDPYLHALAGTVNPSCSADTSNLWAATFHALDILGIGLAVCDMCAVVLATNGTAKKILNTGDALQISESGELRTTARNAPAIADALKRLEQAGGNGKPASGANAFLIPRKSGARPITALMRRIDAPPATGSSRQVLIMMLDGTLSVSATSSDLQQLYGFTPGETRLANLLMSGKSLADSCDELGVRLSTGCSHLRKIFKKTKTHRQGELVALLLRSIGLLRNRNVMAGNGEEREELIGHNDVSFPGLIQVDVDSDL